SWLHPHLPAQARGALRAESVVFRIDLPDVGGERHRAPPFRAVDQPEHMAGFVERLFHDALQAYLAIRRETVKLLLQARQRDHAGTAIQLRMTEHECEHRNEQIMSGHREQLPCVLRAAPEQHLLDWNRRILAACRVERELDVSQIQAAHWATEF